MKFPAPWSLSPEDWGQGVVRVMAERQHRLARLLSCASSGQTMHPRGLLSPLGVEAQSSYRLRALLSKRRVCV